MRSMTAATKIPADRNAFVIAPAEDHPRRCEVRRSVSEGSRFVAVNLRGHGASDAPGQEYTLAG